MPLEIVRPVIARMRPQFDEKQIQLWADVPDSLPQVHADVDRTAQVLTNLMGNALQYTPNGGEVRVTARHEAGKVRFAVSDTGMGPAPDDLKQIFQRFYRVDKSRARASGGSGIGLTVAKHLIASQDGDIHAESEGPGKGSVFVFTLPAV